MKHDVDPENQTFAVGVKFEKFFITPPHPPTEKNSSS